MVRNERDPGCSPVTRGLACGRASSAIGEPSPRMGEGRVVHPAMATSRIDWDGALVRAIPAVEKAGSDQEYRKAIASMLAELNDPVTRVVEKEPAESPPRPRPAAAIRLEAIDPNTASLTVPNDPRSSRIRTYARSSARDSPRRRTSTGSSSTCVAGTGAVGGVWTRSSSAHHACWTATLRSRRTLPEPRVLHDAERQRGRWRRRAWDSGLKVVSSGSVRGEGHRARHSC